MVISSPRRDNYKVLVVKKYRYTKPIPSKVSTKHSRENEEEPVAEKLAFYLNGDLSWVFKQC